MLYSIYAESTPNPKVMKFVANRMLADKSIEITTLEEAKGISIAEELLKFPFVKSIYLSSNFISISKNGTIAWENIAMQLRIFILDFLNKSKTVINYTENPQLLITRALSPAKVSSVKINEETKRAEVMLRPEEVSKAIGRGGQNIRLAGKLTGYEIDVFREGVEEDVELSEFSDEIEAWVINEFSKVGLDTARSILDKDVEDIVKRTDLEEETVLDVVRILKEEFED